MQLGVGIHRKGTPGDFQHLRVPARISEGYIGIAPDDLADSPCPFAASSAAVLDCAHGYQEEEKKESDQVEATRRQESQQEKTRE